MIKVFLISGLLQIFLFGGCQEKTSFEKKIISFFKKDYKMTRLTTYKKNDKLRSNLFHSQNFLYAKGYSYEPLDEINNKIDFNVPFSRISIYYYKDTLSPLKTIISIDSIKKARQKEGFYGPFGKDYNLFFSSGNVVVHLERSCNVSQEYWENMKNEIFVVAKESFKSISRIVDKQCE